MFRRCVIACLLVGYLAGQLAAVPHGHEHARDDGRAHAHIGWLVPATSFAEHHHDSGHSHTSLPARSGKEHHDSDLVYLPDGEVANIGKIASLDTPIDTVVGSAHIAADSPQLAIHKADRRGVPPADEFARCALFLKLRTLRI